MPPLVSFIISMLLRYETVWDLDTYCNILVEKYSISSTLLCVQTRKVFRVLFTISHSFSSFHFLSRDSSGQEVTVNSMSQLQEKIGVS